MVQGINLGQLFGALGQLQQVNAEEAKRKMAEDDARRQGISALTTTAGTIIGSIYGGAPGAAAGGAVGGAVGGMVGGKPMTTSSAAKHAGNIATQYASAAKQDLYKDRIASNAEATDKSLAAYSVRGADPQIKNAALYDLQARANKLNELDTTLNDTYAGLGANVQQADFNFIDAQQREMDARSGLDSLMQNPSVASIEAIPEQQNILSQAQATQENISQGIASDSDKIAQVDAIRPDLQKQQSIVSNDIKKVKELPDLTQDQVAANNFVKSMRSEVIRLASSPSKGKAGEANLKSIQQIRDNTALAMANVSKVPKEERENYFKNVSVGITSPSATMKNIVSSFTKPDTMWGLYNNKTGKMDIPASTHAAVFAAYNANPDLYTPINLDKNLPPEVRKAKELERKNQERTERNNALKPYAVTVSEDPEERKQQISSDPKLMYLGGVIPKDAELEQVSLYSKASPDENQASLIRKKRAARNSRDLLGLTTSLDTNKLLGEINKKQAYASAQDAGLNRWVSLGEQTGVRILVPKMLEDEKIYGSGDNAGDKAITLSEKLYTEKYVPIVNDQLVEQGKNLSLYSIDKALTNLGRLPGKVAEKAYARWDKRRTEMMKDITDRKSDVKEEEKRKWDVGTKLRTELTKYTTQYTKVKGLMNAVNISAENGEKYGGVADMSLVFAYMKMLDPDSTVREGEQASAKNAPGIPASIRVTYNKAVDAFKGKFPQGDIFTPESRKKFAGMTKDLWEKSYKKSIDDYTTKYTYLAEQAGVPVGWVTGEEPIKKPEKVPEKDNKNQSPDEDLDLLNKYLK